KKVFFLISCFQKQEENLNQFQNCPYKIMIARVHTFISVLDNRRSRSSDRTFQKDKISFFPDILLRIVWPPKHMHSRSGLLISVDSTKRTLPPGGQATSSYARS